MDTSVLRFAVVGGFGTLVNTGYLILFKEYLGAPLWLASTLAICVAIVFNYILNDNFTFPEKKGSFPLFVTACFIGVLINIEVLLTLSSVGVYYIVANLLGILCAFVYNYTVCRLFVWREST